MPRSDSVSVGNVNLYAHDVASASPGELFRSEALSFAADRAVANACDTAVSRARLALSLRSASSRKGTAAAVRQSCGTNDDHDAATGNGVEPASKSDSAIVPPVHPDDHQLVEMFRRRVCLLNLSVAYCMVAFGSARLGPVAQLQAAEVIVCPVSDFATTQVNQSGHWTLLVIAKHSQPRSPSSSSAAPASCVYTAFHIDSLPRVSPSGALSSSNAKHADSACTPHIQMVPGTPRQPNMFDCGPYTLLALAEVLSICSSVFAGAMSAAGTTMSDENCPMGTAVAGVLVGGASASRSLETQPNPTFFDGGRTGSTTGASDVAAAAALNLRQELFSEMTKLFDARP